MIYSLVSMMTLCNLAAEFAMAQDSEDDKNTVAENVKVKVIADDDDSNHGSFELNAPAKLIELVHLASSPKVFSTCRGGESCAFGQWGIIEPKEEILVVLKKLGSKKLISATKATEGSLEFTSESIFPPGEYQVLFNDKEVDLVDSTAYINVEVKAYINVEVKAAR